MRRRTILEGAVHAAKALFDICLGKADQFKRLDHEVRRLVTDGTRSNFEAVADCVVLVSLIVTRILIFQRIQTALRHGERVVSEVDLLFFFVVFEEREVNDPAELVTVRGSTSSVPHQRGCGLHRQNL